MTERIETLVQQVAELMIDRGYLLATTESCTGGWVSQCLTSVPGSSAWFDRGFVCYSNQAKQEMLGVLEETLESHGAVSEPVAAAMAEGALRFSPADWTLSITGVAGPDGGSPEKPVGMVCFAWASADSCETQTCLFSGDRTSIREQAVYHALSGLLMRAGRTLLA